SLVDYQVKWERTRADFNTTEISTLNLYGASSLLKRVSEYIKIMILEGSGRMSLNTVTSLLHEQSTWTEGYPTCN
ncbi:hypothetical protein E2320_021133, partial [Naja naja]